MIKKILLVCLVLLFAIPAFAQETQNGNEFRETPMTDALPIEEFLRAKVIEITDQRDEDVAGIIIHTQTFRVRITNGSEKGQERVIENNGLFTINGGKGVSLGEQIILYKVTIGDETNYTLADTYRVPYLLVVVLIFFVTAIGFSRWKGVMSLLGLGVSILVIVKFIVPQIIDGKNPLVISIIGGLIIMFCSIYLAHGFNRRTTIALVSTLLTLGLASALAIIFVNLTKLFGTGTEEAFYVQQLGTFENLNLKGLLLGGIILGALGVLDDITTSQSASIDELKKANPNLTFRQLYNHGVSIGREHISSLVNTLFLAYAGASLPLFLFFSVESTQPIWVTLNSEFISEEIVRTLVGSTALILAVPITTILASYYFSNWPSVHVEDSSPTPAGHVHKH